METFNGKFFCLKLLSLFSWWEIISYYGANLSPKISPQEKRGNPDKLNQIDIKGHFWVTNAENSHLKAGIKKTFTVVDQIHPNTTDYPWHFATLTTVKDITIVIILHHIDCHHLHHHRHHHLCELQVGLSSMTTKVTERDNEALAPSSFFSFLHNLSSCITVIVVVKTIIIPRKQEESNISIFIEAPKRKL